VSLLYEAAPYCQEGGLLRRLLEFLPDVGATSPAPLDQAWRVFRRARPRTCRRCGATYGGLDTHVSGARQHDIVRTRPQQFKFVVLRRRPPAARTEFIVNRK